MKSRCCPNTPNRKIARSIHESARDVARDVAKTDAYKQSRRDRKKVEVLFAHLKRILKLDRLRSRGPSGAHHELLLAATAQDLQRMAKWLCQVDPRLRVPATRLIHGPPQKTVRSDLDCANTVAIDLKRRRPKRGAQCVARGNESRQVPGAGHGTTSHPSRFACVLV